MEFVYAGMTMNRKSLEEALEKQVREPKDVINDCIQFLTKYPEGDFRINNKKLALSPEDKGRRQEG